MILIGDPPLQPSSDFVFDHMNGAVLSVTNLSHSILFYIISFNYFLLLLLQMADFKNDNVPNPVRLFF